MYLQHAVGEARVAKVSQSAQAKAYRAVAVKFRAAEGGQAHLPGVYRELRTGALGSTTLLACKLCSCHGS